MISARWTKDGQKRGTFPFKTPLDLSRYEFRSSRYRRVKRNVIFHRFTVAVMLAPFVRSFAYRSYPKLDETSDSCEGKNVGRSGSRVSAHASRWDKKRRWTLFRGIIFEHEWNFNSAPLTFVPGYRSMTNAWTAVFLILIRHWGTI